MRQFFCNFAPQMERHRLKKKFGNIDAPLLPITVCMIVGIACCWLLDDWHSWLMVLLPVFVLTGVTYRFPKIQTIGIYCCTALLGALLGSHADEELNVAWPEEPMPLQVVTVSEPTAKEKTIAFDVLTIDGGQKVKCRFLRTAWSEQLTIGEGLWIRGRVTPPHEWHNGHFDYQQYMSCHGFVGEVFVGWNDWQPVTVSTEKLSRLQRVRLRMLVWRHQLLEQYKSWHFDDDTYGVLAAMTLGDKSQLDSNVKDVYSQVGASHILALSGMHLMIIYTFLSLFVGFRRWRILSQVVVILAVWTFAFLVGLPASAVRASAMITIYGIMSVGYREKMSVNTLAFVAIVMLAISPLSIYDVGFQLSFMAVLAIVLMNKVYERMVPVHVWQKYRLLSYCWGLVTVSLSAQIGTAPLVAYYFGRLPTYFLLSNMVVIPLATAILYIALCSLIISWWTWLQHLLVMTLAYVVSLMNSLLQAIAALPGCSVEVHINSMQLWLLYVIIGSLWVLLMVTIPLSRRSV